MTEPKGNDLTRFAVIINHAIALDKVGEVGQAVQLLSDLTAEFPEAASTHGYLGWFLLQLGRNVEAIIQSRHAVRLAPRSEKASLIHFHVLWKSGEHIEALDEMKRFLTIRPSEVYAGIIKEWQPNQDRTSLGRPQDE
ncbi:MAG: hypothetical protein K8T91_19075 [Planctomycetes bacterium]|nr:hypothetical protein [Planctomycetota bacterium]